jgi:hypothetical protein
LIIDHHPRNSRSMDRRNAYLQQAHAEKSCSTLKDKLPTLAVAAIGEPEHSIKFPHLLYVLGPLYFHYKS